MRQAAALSPYRGNAGNVTVADWMDATTKYIDGLKSAEDRLLSDFAATVQERRSEARWGFWSLLAVLLGLLAITCAVCLVRRALDHASGRAAGRHDGDAGRGQERHRGARHRARRRARAHGAGRAGVPRRGDREEPPGSRIRRPAEGGGGGAPAQRGGAGPPRRRRSSMSSTRSAKGSSSSPRARSPTGSPTEFADEYKKVQSDFNAAIAQLQETIGAIVTSVREVSNAAGEISTEHDRPVAADRRAGGEPGRDLRRRWSRSPRR